MDKNPIHLLFLYPLSIPRVLGMNSWPAVATAARPQRHASSVRPAKSLVPSLTRVPTTIDQVGTICKSHPFQF